MNFPIRKRKDVQWEEALENPIFLYQVRELYPRNEDYDCCGDHDHDCENQIDGDYDSIEQLEESEYWETWRTEAVYFSREEAELDNGLDHRKYPPNKRVYAVPAHGILTKILKGFSVLIEDQNNG